MASVTPSAITPRHTSATATSASGGRSSLIPAVAKVSTATTAPELLHMGEDIESSIYRSPT